jgi:FolB domain-containing protein
MMLKIRNLRAYTIVGVNEDELKNARPLNLSVILNYDHTKAVTEDTLEHAIDYSTIESAIVAALAQQQFKLIETVAEYVCQLVLSDERVTDVTVEIEKPGVMQFAEMVSVIHTLSRE